MDELLLSKVRLAIIAQLLPAEWVTFTELQKSIDATNGNLGAHLAKLVDAGYVKEEKRFDARRPQSRYRLTKTGRAAFLRHVADLQALLDPR
jgi:DNA-binding MarR family transcriptional regulator